MDPIGLKTFTTKFDNLKFHMGLAASLKTIINLTQGFFYDQWVISTNIPALVSTIFLESLISGYICSVNDKMVMSCSDSSLKFYGNVVDFSSTIATVISYSGFIYFLSKGLVTFQSYYLLMVVIHWVPVCYYILRKRFTPKEAATLPKITKEKIIRSIEIPVIGVSWLNCFV